MCVSIFVLFIFSLSFSFFFQFFSSCHLCNVLTLRCIDSCLNSNFVASVNNFRVIAQVVRNELLRFKEAFNYTLCSLLNTSIYLKRPSKPHIAHSYTICKYFCNLHTLALLYFFSLTLVRFSSCSNSSPFTKQKKKRKTKFTLVK